MFKTFTIQNVVVTTLHFELYFEEDILTASAVLIIPRSWFRNIGAPKKGMQLRMIQEDRKTTFYLNGVELASPKTKLSLSAEEVDQIMERQRLARERIERIKALHHPN